MKRSIGKDLLDPIYVAINGLVYTFKTQRHMRVHLGVVVVVTLMGIYFKLRIKDLLLLLFTIDLVLVAEMFNSAIEATVDLVEPKYNPLAKFAKDISAGAVLITSTIALLVGGILLLSDARFEDIQVSLTKTPLEVMPVASRILLGMFLMLIVVVIGKGLGRHGQVFKGGVVSGHSAFGFFFAWAAVFLSGDLMVSSIVLVLAALIAQSRWEAKIHSAFELALGAGVGTLLAILLFGLGFQRNP